MPNADSGRAKDELKLITDFKSRGFCVFLLSVIVNACGLDIGMA